MNKVILCGNIVRDLELKQTQSGMSYLNFSVALNRGKDKDGNDKGADYPNCKAFGKTAETIANYMSKGSKILLEGRIQTGSYEKDGQKVYTTDVMVDRFEFVGAKSGDTQSVKTTDVEDEVLAEEQDDVPF